MDNKTNKHEFACNAGKITEYEVKEHIDTIMVGFRGFSKEVSIVKWNDKNPVFDIRAWRVSDRDGLQYPLRGITFSKEEFIKLREILNSIDVNCIDEYMWAKNVRYWIWTEQRLKKEITVYCTSDDLLEFYSTYEYYNGVTLELWAQYNGNFETTIIDERNFP